jgi:ketosteroid isomerase-like protein
MKTTDLRINELSSTAYDAYLRYLTAMDAKDLERYGEFLADDVVLQMNNAEPTVGKAAVLAGLAQYWPSFATIEHDLLNIYGTDDHYVLEALNHYTTHDGRAVTLRAVAFTDKDADGQVESVRLYTDTTPLFAA